jgi:hypothetical protein
MGRSELRPYIVVGKFIGRPDLGLRTDASNLSWKRLK